MKNLLVIAYYFPPSGGPGVQRVLKNIKYLPEFGWNPIVLTVSNGSFPARDESLLKQIPEGIIVKRTHIYEPYDIYLKFMGKPKNSAIDVNTIKKDDQKLTFKEKVAEFIRATFFIPDARIGWLISAKPAVRELIEKYDIKAIYSSSPPYTCSIIAQYAKRKYNLPWVAGFRDPWTGFISSPKRWFIPRAIDKAKEHSVFKESDKIEVAWKGIIADARNKYPNIPEDKFFHAPNGYDSSDFPKVDAQKNAKFTVTYTGSMYGRRNPTAFFQAVEKLIHEKKIEKEKLHFRFVGRFGSEIEEVFQKGKLCDIIEQIGYVPHEKSIEYLMRSDLLLLIVDESKESNEIVPGKVYEYIGVQKPVLAIAPEDSAIKQLIDETEAGGTAHQSNIGKIANVFMKYYKMWTNLDSNYKANMDKISKYERKESTKKLAATLDTLVN